MSSSKRHVSKDIRRYVLSVRANKVKSNGWCSTLVHDCQLDSTSLDRSEWQPYLVFLTLGTALTCRFRELLTFASVRPCYKP